MSDVDPVDPDRWRRANDLFHRALELPTDRRAPFLADACGGDDRLREEVESLLAAHSRAADFLNTPPRAVAALAADAAGDPPVPDRIGPYVITGLLGRGGMGVVYRAEDTRLGRVVALKAIAPWAADDDARRERLRREARAAAALSHPGIATVYALEDIDGQLYLATEYVAGDTLRQELARGAMPLARAVDTALKMARAVAAAHGRGIVHRDLKPENVMRTPTGDLKVLDFGLAHVEDPAASPRLTIAGLLLGTPAYMAPEQVRGLPVDPRTDVFALGVILYELISGTNPFAADDAPSTLAKILETEAPRIASRLPAGTPSETVLALDRTVRLCLRKAPAERFESAAELAGALEQVRRLLTDDLPGSGTQSSLGAAGARSRWWWQFHQATAVMAYVLLLWPLWHRRAVVVDAPTGTILFVVGLTAAVVASTLRLHRWFAIRLNPAAGLSTHIDSGRWLLAADLLFAAVLAVEGVFAVLAAPAWGVLLVSAAASILVSTVIIEPTTAREAFRHVERR